MSEPSRPGADDDCSATPLCSRESLRKPHQNRITPSDTNGPHGTKASESSSSSTNKNNKKSSSATTAPSLFSLDPPPLRQPKPADEKENPRQPSFTTAPPSYSLAESAAPPPPMMMMMVAGGGPPPPPPPPQSFAYPPEGAIIGYHHHHHPMMMPAPPPLPYPMMRYMSSAGSFSSSTGGGAAADMLPFPYLAYSQSFGVNGLFGPAVSHYPPYQPVATNSNYSSNNGLNHHQQQPHGGGGGKPAHQHQRTALTSSTTTTGSSTGTSDLDIAVSALLELTPSMSKLFVPPSTTSTHNNNNNNRRATTGHYESEPPHHMRSAATASPQQPRRVLTHNNSNIKNSNTTIDHHHHQESQQQPHIRTVAAKPFALTQKNIIKPTHHAGPGPAKHKYLLGESSPAATELTKRRKIGPGGENDDRPGQRNEFKVRIVVPAPMTTTTRFQAAQDHDIAAMLQHSPAHTNKVRNVSIAAIAATSTKKEEEEVNYDHTTPDFPDELAFMLHNHASLAKTALQLIEESEETDVACKCKNTKCLKLYCSCFQAGKLCNSTLCRCNGCENTAKHSVAGGSRTKAIFDTLKRRPNAFDKRLRKKTGEGCFCKRTRYVHRFVVVAPA
jgi:Tesmin/TSO1-like CXC domain, cysteine-rich domain